jgi:hypothetical protein
MPKAKPDCLHCKGWAMNPMDDDDDGNPGYDFFGGPCERCGGDEPADELAITEQP